MYRPGAKIDSGKRYFLCNKCEFFYYILEVKFAPS